MIRINGLKLPPDYTPDQLTRACEKELRRKGLPKIRILKRSLDSRDHERIRYVLSVGIEGYTEQQEKKICQSVNRNNVMLTKEKI